MPDPPTGRGGGHRLLPVRPTQPNLFSIAGLEERIHSVAGDIRDLQALKAAFDAARPEIVLHMAAQPIVRDSYKNSFFPSGTPAVSTARAGNVIGGGDFANDRIIPDCVRAIEAETPILVRNPYSTRPYQHVLEPLFAYLMIAQRQCEEPSLAGWYNVGPDERDCVTTGELVRLFCEKWGGGTSWIDHSEVNAPHEASFLKLDCSKLKATFGWCPRWNIEKAVEKTIEWTKVWLSGGDIPAVMSRQIVEYWGE